jgi:MFS family permease
MPFVLYSRLAIHTVLNGIPCLAYQWTTIVLPELLRNSFGITDKTMVSFYASLFYVSYFCGIFLSCFIWPFVVKRVSKRRCVVFSTIMYGIITMCSGIGNSLTVLLLCRFLTGMFLNVNSIGKDLLFEFTKGNLRQMGLSFDSAIALVMNLAGPFFGLQIYHATGDSLQSSLIWIGSIYLVSAFFFIIFFFIVPYSEKHRNSFDEDEAIRRQQMELSQDGDNAPLMQEKKGKMQLVTRSTKEVIYWAIHYKPLRNPILVYGISLAVTNCDLLLTVIFLETAWADSGMGIEAGSLSLLFALSVIPAVIILVVTPTFCPSKISYSAFMRIFMSVFGTGVLLTPLLRDLIPERNHNTLKTIAYAIVMVKNCSNGRLYAPFIHFHLNSKCNRYIRTLINTINFIVATSLTIIAVNLIVPLESILLFDPRFREYAPYNKYPLFLVLVALQMISLILIQDDQNDQVLESVTEI